MNTKLTLKNFRVFDNKQGGTFNLAPITILTGCNSSGKSSLVKALLLLKDFFQELATNKINDCKLDFGNTQAKLGRYDLALNNKSRKNGKMCFAYTVYSKELGEDLQVKLWIASNANDTLNNGWLERIEISKIANQSIVFDLSIDRNEGKLHFHKINLKDIKKNFLKKVYWYLLIRNAKFAFPSKVENEGKTYKYTEKDLAECNQILKIMSAFLPQEEVEKASKEASKVLGRYIEVDGTTSDFDENIYVNGWIKGVTFPLPILLPLTRAKKQDVRKIIYSSSELDMANSYIKNGIEAILSEFELSKYDNFIEYFKAKENQFLCFKNIAYEVSKEICYQVNETLWFSNECSGIGKLYNETIKFSDLLHLNDRDGECDSECNSNTLSFGYIFSVMTEVSRRFNPQATSSYIKEYIFSMSDGYEQHQVFDDFCNYFDKIIKEVLSPEQFVRFKYIGDADIEIKRIYSLENSDKFGQLLAKYIEMCRKGQTGKYIPGVFLNKWVKAFGIGERLEFKYAADGYGVLVRLYKDINDKDGRLLVDEGYGITKLITTLINIELAMLSKGYKPITLAIEEPENHLHPRYQSLLAEMFADAYKNYGIHFIVETHSEYMVRKLQTLVAKKELTPDEVSLQYLYSPDIEQRPKGEPQVKNIPIREDGILKEPFGPGFLDEADNLAMDILTIKAMS